MEGEQGQGNEMARGPPGWEVEPRPRTTEKYKGKIDWFYYEPGTGKQYRSRVKAWARYEQMKQGNPNDVSEESEQDKDVQSREPIPQGSSEPTIGNSSRMRKPNMKRLAMMKGRTASFDVLNSPESVSWVLTDVEKDKWNPFIGDKMVPEVEHKLWEETFELSIMWKGWPGSKEEGNQEEAVRRGNN